MSEKPVIGITASPVADHQAVGQIERYRVSADYVNAIAAAGGLPLVLPPQVGNTRQILGLVDGLLLSGGADIDPKRYGDNDQHPETYDVSQLRDEFELELIAAALVADIPLLCICRGIQVLNVALGGTLHQHIPDAIDQTLEHRQSAIGLAPGDPAHAVSITPGSVTATIFGQLELSVNSHHHQSIKSVAPTLSVEAVSADGVIEAVSLQSSPFVYGMQWHPELMFSQSTEHFRPFVAFVEAARHRGPVRDE